MEMGFEVRSDLYVLRTISGGIVERKRTWKDSCSKAIGRRGRHLQEIKRR